MFSTLEYVTLMVKNEWKSKIYVHTKLLRYRNAYRHITIDKNIDYIYRGIIFTGCNQMNFGTRVYDYRNMKDAYYWYFHTDIHIETYKLQLIPSYL